MFLEHFFVSWGSETDLINEQNSWTHSVYVALCSSALFMSVIFSVHTFE